MKFSTYLTTNQRCLQDHNSAKESGPLYLKDGFLVQLAAREITLHSYRHRHLNAPGEERFIDVERMLATGPPITVPSIVLRGADSGFGAPAQGPSAVRERFTQLIARRIVTGAGHDLPVQGPDEVAGALLELL